MKHYVYTDYKKFFEELKTDTIDQIKRFYVRNGATSNDGKIDIIISMDGSYPKRTSRTNYDSIYCITFVIEAYTGTVLDYEVIQKCLKTGKGHDSRLEFCADKLFHGSSSSMEVAAAVNLFTRSADPMYPFRYKVVVSDGDCKAFDHVQKLYPYGRDVLIENESCVYHLRKAKKVRLQDCFKYAKFGNIQKQGNLKYPYRNRMANLALRFSNLYLHVIKNIVTSDQRNRTESVKKDLANKFRPAVRAIPRHYMDHIGASFEDRCNKYHSMCDQSFCPFLQLDSKDRVTYEPTNSNGKQKKW